MMTTSKPVFQRIAKLWVNAFWIAMTILLVKPLVFRLLKLNILNVLARLKFYSMRFLKLDLGKMPSRLPL